MARAPSLRCSLVYSQPAAPAENGGAYAQVDREDTTEKHARVDRLAGN